MLPKMYTLARIMGWLQIILGGLLIVVSMASLFKFYHAGFFLQNEDIRRHFCGVKDVYDGFDLRALNDRVREVLDRKDKLQEKLERTVQGMEKQRDVSDKSNITRLEYKSFLEQEVIRPLYSAHIALRQIRLPNPEGIRNSTMREEPLVNTFIIEEIQKYISPKENRVGKINIYGTEGIWNTIGHACVSMKNDLEEYMDYDIGSYCKDDWNLAQKLMVSGCEPLPWRWCLTRSSKVYQKPYSINESYGKSWMIEMSGGAIISACQARTPGMVIKSALVALTCIFQSKYILLHACNSIKFDTSL